MNLLALTIGIIMGCVVTTLIIKIINKINDKRNK